MAISIGEIQFCHKEGPQQVGRDAGFDLFWGRYSGFKLKIGAEGGDFIHEWERDFVFLRGRDARIAKG